MWALKTLALTTFLLLFSFMFSGCGFSTNTKRGLEIQNSDIIESGSLQDFMVNVGNRIFFDLDSSFIRPDAQVTLERQAHWLNRYSEYMVTIEGHADERGTREYNLALGQRRAVAARDFLISQGVLQHRMKTVSYGKERPIAICDNLFCWSQNRRAMIIVK